MVTFNATICIPVQVRDGDWQSRLHALTDRVKNHEETRQELYKLNDGQHMIAIFATTANDFKQRVVQAAAVSDPMTIPSSAVQMFQIDKRLRTSATSESVLEEIANTIRRGR